MCVLDRTPVQGDPADRNKIGTGLFVGSGATLSTVGPAPLFMAFVVMSLVIWAVMNALAEMTTYMPVQGASAPYYIRHFFEPSLAFAAGNSPSRCALDVGLEVDRRRLELLVCLLDADCGRNLCGIGCDPGKPEILALTRNMH